MRDVAVSAPTFINIWRCSGEEHAIETAIFVLPFTLRRVTVPTAPIASNAMVVGRMISR